MPSYPDEGFNVFFVLNGLFNGEEGVKAATIGLGKRLEDGWYYLLQDQEDGVGPYRSKEEAVRAGEQSEVTWAFHPNGVFVPYAERVHEGTEWVPVTIKKQGKDHYHMSCVEYYSSEGILRLEITQPFDRALNTFALLLRADNRLESGPARPSS